MVYLIINLVYLVYLVIIKPTTLTLKIKTATLWVFDVVVLVFFFSCLSEWTTKKKKKKNKHVVTGKRFENKNIK